MPGKKKTIRVYLDLEDFTLSVRKPPKLKPGTDVVWKFGSQNGPRASENYLPPGWVPMVNFEAVHDTGATNHYGPFKGLTQILKKTTKEGSRFEVHGESGGPEGSAFDYVVFLHRDLGGDKIESFAILASARQALEIEGAPGGDPRASTIRVSRGERLIVGNETQEADNKTSVEWDFRGADDNGFLPLVLFYEFRKPDKPRRKDSEPTKIHFGPFKKLRYEGAKVIASEISDKRGFYHYETALLSTRDRSVRFVNSGDPRIDNKGEVIPPDERGGKKGC